MRKIGALAVLLLASVPAATADVFGTAGPYVAGNPGPQVWSDEYIYDDGSAEGALGLTAGGDICWIHYFDPIAGLETITDIRSSFGTRLLPGASPPAGTPVDVYVWDDANNDTDPSDAVLRGQGSGVIQFPDTDILETFALDAPITVTSRFFIGAVVSHTSERYPAPMDHHHTSNGRAWVVANTVTGGFDPNNLLNNDVGPYEMDSIGFPCVWLLRADAIPEPTALILLGMGGLALRRR